MFRVSLNDSVSDDIVTSLKILLNYAYEAPLITYIFCISDSEHVTHTIFSYYLLRDSGFALPKVVTCTLY